MVKQTKKGPTLEPFARIGQHGRYHGRLGPVRVLGSGLAVLAALLVACGRNGGSTVIQGATAGATPSAVSAPDPGGSAGTARDSGASARIVLDQGRVALASLPSGYVQRDEGQLIKGIHGESIMIHTFVNPGAGQGFIVAVHRGPGVLDELTGPRMSVSSLASIARGTLYQYEQPANLGRELAWSIGSDAVIWLTSANLDFADLAKIVPMVETVS